MRRITRDPRWLLILALGAVPGCSTDDGSRSVAGDSDAHQYFHTEEQVPAAEWGYEGEIGPEHWGDLSPEYVLASTGRQQSPIDLRGAIARDLAPIEFDYRPESINLVYNGHTIEEIGDQTSAIVVDGTRYTLQQFHFHTPSEHTVRGRHADMEVHLVHKSAGGDVAVVSLMINAGSHDPEFDRILDYLPSAANRARTSTATMDSERFLPSDRGYYRYEGSLTTPPCTEDVLWFVFRSPVELSASQIGKIHAVIGDNNRPVQPLNGRQVLASE
ncbi:MAG: carbonic anhydrase family protein [Planctomycetes bacterium]|nr:carbonic anhydrase family protein [Planctomycetota bacterium]